MVAKRLLRRALVQPSARVALGRKALCNLARLSYHDVSRSFPNPKHPLITCSRHFRSIPVQSVFVFPSCIFQRTTIFLHCLLSAWLFGRMPAFLPPLFGGPTAGSTNAGSILTRFLSFFQNEASVCTDTRELELTYEPRFVVLQAISTAL